MARVGKVKVKTRSTVKKRIKITATGKIMKKHVRIGHLNSKVSSKTKRRKSGEEQMSKGMSKRVMKQIAR